MSLRYKPWINSSRQAKLPNSIGWCSRGQGLGRSHPYNQIYLDKLALIQHIRLLVAEEVAKMRSLQIRIQERLMLQLIKLNKGRVQKEIWAVAPEVMMVVSAEKERLSLANQTCHHIEEMKISLHLHPSQILLIFLQEFQQLELSMIQFWLSLGISQHIPMLPTNTLILISSRGIQL